MHRGTPGVGQLERLFTLGEEACLLPMNKTAYLKEIEERVRTYYDEKACIYQKLIRRHRYCYGRITRLLRHLIPQPGRVLEIGCGIGQNLAALNPDYGLGIDCSPNMVEEARKLHPPSEYPNLEFRCMSALDVGSIGEKFDTIVMVLALTEIPDVVAALKELRKLCTPRTRIVHVTFNYRWEPILRLGAKLGLCQKHPAQNWLSRYDYESMLDLAEFQLLREGFELLLPVGIPLLSNVVNRFASVVPFVRSLSMIGYGVIRPLMPPGGGPEAYSATVVVPCKNEERNVDGLVERIPDMGKGTEIIFVDDRSSDNTNQKIRDNIDAHPEKNIKLVVGPGQGKGAACRAGFAHAHNDVLMILDADMTTMPEILPEFFEAITTGKGEFINGSRLVYPMQGRAMRFLNVLGNKVFAVLFSWLLGQQIKDTLCGTKVIWRDDYDKILEAREHFGRIDVWGDYDWILGASRHNLRIVELPVHYVERTTGETKMTKRFHHALIMLKICNLAFWRMKVL